MESYVEVNVPISSIPRISIRRTEKKLNTSFSLRFSDKVQVANSSRVDEIKTNGLQNSISQSMYNQIFQILRNLWRDASMRKE